MMQHNSFASPQQQQQQGVPFYANAGTIQQQQGGFFPQQNQQQQPYMMMPQGAPQPMMGFSAQQQPQFAAQAQQFMMPLQGGGMNPYVLPQQQPFMGQMPQQQFMQQQPTGGYYFPGQAAPQGAPNNLTPSPQQVGQMGGLIPTQTPGQYVYQMPNGQLQIVSMMPQPTAAPGLFTGNSGSGILPQSSPNGHTQQQVGGQGKFQAAAGASQTSQSAGQSNPYYVVLPGATTPGSHPPSTNAFTPQQGNSLTAPPILANPTGWSPSQTPPNQLVGASAGSMPNLFVVPNGSAAASPQSSLTGYPHSVILGNPAGAVMPQAMTMLPMGGNSMHSFSMTGASSQTAGGSMSTRPPTDVLMWGYAVVDQYHPSLQRLPVPPSVVSKTRGTVAYNNDVQASSTKPCGSTVCLKFTTRSAPASESCPLEGECPSFHVERSYLEAARTISDPLCCGLHNDYFSQELLSSNTAPHLMHQRFILVLEDRAEIELSPVQLSLTVGLDQLTHRGPIASGPGATKVINMRKQVCRLHYEGKCKWTKDCGHVHLCRELHRYIVSFHFPSLQFLLNTETNSDKILAKLRDEPQLGEFVRSRCVLPLITQMIDGKKTTALRALLAAGSAVTLEQLDAIKAIDDAEGEQVLERSITPSAYRCVVTQVHTKIAPLLNPKALTRSNPTTALSPVRIPTSHAAASTHMSASAPMSSHDDSDAGLIAMQVAEAGITSPTRPEAGSLTMPTFSPSVSVTSAPDGVASPPRPE